MTKIARMDQVFVYKTPVRFTHTDPAGYVFYPRFFEMFQATVEDWFNVCLEINYADQILKHGVGLPTAHTECDFLKPCKLGELLELSLVLEAFGTSSIRVRFDGHIGGEHRLTARSVLVAIELDVGKPRPIGRKMRKKLAAYLEICRGYDEEHPEEAATGL